MTPQQFERELLRRGWQLISAGHYKKHTNNTGLGITPAGDKYLFRYVSSLDGHKIELEIKANSETIVRLLKTFESLCHSFDLTIIEEGKGKK